MAQSSELRLQTSAEWKRQVIEDIELQAIDARVPIPPTARGSDMDLRATAVANALGVLTANQVVLDADSDPLRAENDKLDEIREVDGLPKVPATAATGLIRVVSTALSAVTVPDGTRVLCPGALPGKVVGTIAGVVTGTELPIVLMKVGSVGNLKAGTVVRFTDPPTGLASEAEIVADMVDGADDESDAKKRRRIINRRRNPPKADNWSRLREIALSATNAINNAFIHPAIGGGSSCKTVLLAPWHNGGSGQSRAVSNGTLDIVRTAFAGQFPTFDRLYAVQSVADEMVDLRLLLDVIPGSASWVDLAPWPSVPAMVTTTTSNTSFRVTLASESTAPTIGKTIAIWSVAELGFRTAVIQSVTAISSTVFAITVNAWQGGNITVANGQQVSPAAGNMGAWGNALLDVFGEQTSGENCLAWQEPRSLRKPVESNDEPVGFGSRELGEFIDRFTEMRDAVIDSINVSDPTRTTPAGQANVLCLRSLSLGVK